MFQNPLKGVRLCFATFYILTLPLFFFAPFAIYAGIKAWPHRRDGVIEGPEPSDTEIVLSLTMLALFALLYLIVFFTARPLRRARRLWLAFAAHIPAFLLWVAFCFTAPFESTSERLWTALYPATLLIVLAAGIYFSIRPPLAAPPQQETAT